LSTLPVRFLGLMLLIVALGVASCSALFDSADRKPSNPPAGQSAGDGR